MFTRAVMWLALLSVGSTAWPQQTIVFPAVSDEVEGMNGSRWVTVARIIKINPQDRVVLRRKWVCLPDGGFLEDPGNQVVWVMPADDRQGRILAPWGNHLFLGVDADLGAVAFDVEGGEVIAHSYVVDVLRGEHIPGQYAAGQGQFIRAMKDPLRGPSHIPWLGACRNAPCSATNPLYYDFHRNNIGIVNPNPEPLTITSKVIPFKGYSGFVREIDQYDPESFSVSVPAYGWKQFKWVSDQYYGLDPFGLVIVPEAGFVISLTPDKDLPYYAYASVVFTPDPDSDNQVFNDPMFVPAEPGYVAPWREIYPPPKSEDE